MKRRDTKRLSTFKSDAAKAKDRMEAVEGIKRGLECMKQNTGKPAEEFFKEFFAEKGISKLE